MVAAIQFQDQGLVRRRITLPSLSTSLSASYACYTITSLIMDRLDRLDRVIGIARRNHFGLEKLAVSYLSSLSIITEAVAAVV